MKWNLIGMSSIIAAYVVLNSSPVFAQDDIKESISAERSHNGVETQETQAPQETPEAAKTNVTSIQTQHPKSDDDSIITEIFSLLLPGVGGYDEAICTDPKKVPYRHLIIRAYELFSEYDKDKMQIELCTAADLKNSLARILISDDTTIAAIMAREYLHILSYCLQTGKSPMYADLLLLKTPKFSVTKANPSLAREIIKTRRRNLLTDVTYIVIELFQQTMIEYNSKLGFPLFTWKDGQCWYYDKIPAYDLQLLYTKAINSVNDSNNAVIVSEELCQKKKELDQISEQISKKTAPDIRNLQVIKQNLEKELTKKIRQAQDERFWTYSTTSTPLTVPLISPQAYEDSIRTAFDAQCANKYSETTSEQKLFAIAHTRPFMKMLRDKLENEDIWEFATMYLYAAGVNRSLEDYQYSTQSDDSKEIEVITDRKGEAMAFLHTLLLCKDLDLYEYYNLFYIHDQNGEIDQNDLTMGLFDEIFKHRYDSWTLLILTKALFSRLRAFSIVEGSLKAGISWLGTPLPPVSYRECADFLIRNGNGIISEAEKNRMIYQQNPNVSFVSVANPESGKPPIPCFQTVSNITHQPICIPMTEVSQQWCCNDNGFSLITTWKILTSMTVPTHDPEIPFMTQTVPVNESCELMCLRYRPQNPNETVITEEDIRTMEQIANFGQ